MEFERVYSSLLDLFPQVDPRALKAVAIEHRKDVDAAVVVVLEEIIPLFTAKSTPSSLLSQNISTSKSSDGSFKSATVNTQREDSALVETLDLAKSSNVDSGKQTPPSDADDGLNEPFKDACVRDHEVEVNTAEMKLSEKTDDNKVKMSSDMHYCEKPFMLKLDTLTPRLINTLGDPETVLGDKCPESGIKVSSDDVFLHTLETSQLDNSVSEELNPLQDKGGVSGNSEDVESHPESSFADGNNLVDETSLLTIDNATVLPSERSEVPDMQESTLDKTASNQENMSNIVGSEEESNLSANMSQSSQIHTIDVIEEIIADARNNKKTLFVAMENLISLIRQVEDKERAAERAKDEAASGGMDIQNKVDELKRMLEYAKKGNNMEAGDVYGEKAILATELRELQARVLSLSDERDKALAVLDEMRQTLDVQLAAAEDKIKSAEQEKLEKENAARKLFSDQELVMEKVVQESKKLKQLAEENAKLQEFLTDRGHTVDVLQGEIAVICQDVRLLKEKFDLHLPLTESLFPSQTSFGLASSSSSLKSLAQDQVQALPVGDDGLIVTEKKRDDEVVLEDKATKDDCKALEDEGWELFETVV